MSVYTLSNGDPSFRSPLPSGIPIIQTSVQQPAVHQQLLHSPLTPSNPKASPYYYDNTPSGGKVVYMNPDFNASVQPHPFNENVFITPDKRSIAGETALTDYSSKSKLFLLKEDEVVQCPSCGNFLSTPEMQYHDHGQFNNTVDDDDYRYSRTSEPEVSSPGNWEGRHNAFGPGGEGINPLFNDGDVDEFDQRGDRYGRRKDYWSEKKDRRWRD